VSRLERLNSQVLKAHETGDTKVLVDIYQMLGGEELDKGEITSACFLLTQAYVYALESGDPRASEIHKILKSHGREE
jgi:hypothetical protein